MVNVCTTWFKQLCILPTQCIDVVHVVHVSQLIQIASLNDIFVDWPL